jgi:Ca-activated chloride channel family protein
MSARWGMALVSGMIPSLKWLVVNWLEYGAAWAGTQVMVLRALARRYCGPASQLFGATSDHRCTKNVTSTTKLGRRITMWKLLMCCSAALAVVSCGGPDHRSIDRWPPPPPPPPAPPGISLGEAPNTETYDRFSGNSFQSVVANPLSTFSIDVDAASYSNVRRYINNNHMPRKDAVRIEELINYFTYDYPDPKGKHPFSINTEISECPWHEAHRLVHIGLQGKRIDTEDLPPNNLVFLLDVSGSMNYHNKLPLLKSAFRLLVEQLRREDRVAIVVYAGAAGEVLPSTPGYKKEKILKAIESLRAGGSTAGGAGIELAYKIARKNFRKYGNNRVILATDGDFNVGASSDAAMVELIEEKREQGIYLTVLGFGTGNLKDSKMEKLADKGNGHYAYVDNILEAKKTLVSELGATLVTIAKDVKIQVEFNPTRVSAYRLVGYENRLLSKEDFADDQQDAGELGAGHSVTALYEIIPAGVESELSPDLPPEVPLKYQIVGVSSEAVDSRELMTVKFRYKRPRGSHSRLIVAPVNDRQVALENTSDDFRFSAAVAEFGMLLRDSKFKGESNYDQVRQLAESSIGDDPEGYRREFLRLVEASRLMSGSLAED